MVLLLVYKTIKLPTASVPRKPDTGLTAAVVWVVASLKTICVLLILTGIFYSLRSGKAGGLIHNEFCHTAVLKQELATRLQHGPV